MKAMISLHLYICVWRDVSLGSVTAAKGCKRNEFLALKVMR